MASGITESRLALGAALEAASIRVAYDPGLVAPPGCLVVPESPWAGPAQLRIIRVLLRWRIVAVAGRADATVTVEELEALVAAVVSAVPREYGLLGFDAPGTIDLAGVQYLAAVGRVSHATEV